MTPDLQSYRWIVVNSSGGKDSQTALSVVISECDRLGIKRDRIVVSHQCLGDMEWPGTKDLVERQAAHYGLRTIISSYQSNKGDALSLLDYVEKRGMWPSSQQRFCTSEFKRGPGGRVLVALYRESPGKILNVYGFRADESPARKKKSPFACNLRFSNQTRRVDDWLPIHSWTFAQVWGSIKASGVPHHSAYDKGMPRLSCCFCIFAPRAALMIAGKSNPKLLDRYVKVENRIGHTFQSNRSIASIQVALRAGETVNTTIADTWNM